MMVLVMLVAGFSQTLFSTQADGRSANPAAQPNPKGDSSPVTEAEQKAAVAVKKLVGGTTTRLAAYPYKTILSGVTLDENHPNKPIIGVFMSYGVVDEKLAGLLNELKHLRSLGGHGITFKPGVLKLLKDHPTLETLRLEGAADLTALKNLTDGPPIKELTLGRESEFTAEHFEAIAKVPSITSVSVDSSTFTGAVSLKAEMLRPLHKLPKLESLEYVVDDISPENLAGFKSLKRLNCFAPNKSVAFFETLAKLPALRSVHLHWYYPDDNPTGPAGVAKLAAITELTELQTNFPLGDANLKALTTLKQLQTLSLPAYQFSPESMGLLAAFPRLTSFTLRYSDKPLTDQTLAKLKELKGLKTLRLHIGKISEVGVVALSNLTELEVLDLAGSQLQPNADKAMPHLAKHAKLHELHLGNETPIANNILTDAGLKELASLKRLKTLRLWIGPFTEVGAASLSSLTELETLYIASTIPGASKATPHVAKLTKLRDLDISSASMSDVNELVSLKALQVLRLRSQFGAATPKGVDVLQKALPNLRVE
ncbi:MAG: hypothetical protein C0467_05020 [Planctomycetaceae bacterium]|nr:hypothetical protein [Planctomycetaceae bacterium]